MFNKLEYKCPKCGSRDIGNRFSFMAYHNDDDEASAEEIVTGKRFYMGSEDYDMHYDTKVCHSCKYWDWMEPVGWDVE